MTTELYKLTAGTKFKIVGNPRFPAAHNPVKDGTVMKLGNIDGMYSYCTTDEGQIVHPVAWQIVEVMP